MARKSRKNLDTTASTATASVKIWSVGAYVRLSSIDRKQKDSIENQQAIIKAFVAEHSDMVLSEIYIDNGTTGQNFERDGFQRMLADMESGKINCCISKDLSRLGRNAIDTGYYIEKYFPTRGIRYIAINDNYDSNDGNSGGIMVSLKNMVNEAYALEVGRKIRATKQMQIRNGDFVGQYAPYGYIKNPDNCHAILVEPTAAVIVKQIFEMAASGETESAILEWLNNNNILPPQQHLHSIGVLTKKQVTKQMLWNKTAIRTILFNRVFVGDMAQGKRYTKSRETTLIPSEKWVITPNTHEAIISREVFDKVQSMHVKTGNNTAKTLEQRRIDNPFVRKVFCGHCGHPLFLEGPKGSSWRSFHCTTREKYGKDTCVPNRIKESKFRAEILSLLQKQAVVFADRQKLAEAAKKPDDKTELNNAQFELDRNSGFLKGLYESLVEGDITETEYREMKLRYEKNIALLTERVAKFKTAALERDLQNKARRKAADSFAGITALTELTADIIDTLIDRITVFENKRIEITFKFDDELAETESLRNE